MAPWFAVRFLLVSPDIVEPVVQDEVGGVQMIHGGEVDARPVDGRLHGVMDVVVLDHVPSLVAEGEDAVAREVREIVVRDVVPGRHGHTGGS